VVIPTYPKLKSCFVSNLAIVISSLPASFVQQTSRAVLQTLDEVGDGFLTYNEILDRTEKKLAPSEKSTVRQTLTLALRILSAQDFISPKHDREVEENEFRIREKGRELLETSASEIREDSESREDIAFVLTKPPFLYSKLLEAGHTFDAFEELIDSAKQKLWIMTPYLDKYIIGAFHRNLREMFRRKELDFRLIVSEINQYSVAAIHTLSELAAAVGKESIAVRVFYQQKSLNDHGQWRVVRTRFSHAKLYLSETEAIITSANLNNESFVSNVEVGLHLRKKALVSEAHEIYETIWKNSEDYNKALGAMH
jgi:hypothetical protein